MSEIGLFTLHYSGRAQHNLIEVFLVMNFDSETWALIDKQHENIIEQYWSRITVNFGLMNPDDTSIAVDRLVKSKRPKAAFDACRDNWNVLSTDELTYLLEANASSDESDAFGQHEMAEAFEALSGRDGVDVDRLTKLEFAFLPVITGSHYGTPNVEQSIQNDPSLFVQILAAIFPRSDDKPDPEEWTIEDSLKRRRFSSAAYHLLDNISIIPKHPDGTIKADQLTLWVNQARQICTHYGRAEIGDSRIGQLLAKEIHSANDGLPQPLAKIIDDCASEKMADGLYIGACNLRGIYMKSNRGGDQEHALAEEYQSYANNIEYLYPFAARALETVAENYREEARREDDELNVRARH